MCYEYSYLNENNQIVSQSVYFKKNALGDVIGLVDSQVNVFATYVYDAWGNILSTQYSIGYSEEYELNHIKYRGYYMDQEIPLMSLFL